MEWRKTYNAQKEYLSGEKGYVIIKTIYSSLTPEIEEMQKWCMDNVIDCWGIGSLAAYKYKITFRIWNKAVIKKFTEKFKDYIDKG